MIKDYAVYLKEVHRMPDRMIPYHLKWVREAYTHSRSSQKLPLNADAKDAYLRYCANQQCNLTNIG